MSEDKNIQGMLAALTSPIEKIYCTQAPHPRAMQPDALAEVASILGKPVAAIANPGEALDAALTTAGNGALILVTGSIFIAASGRIAWFERFSE